MNGGSCGGCPLQCGAPGMQACINCRREVTESKSRLAKRAQRRALGRPECSPESCVAYLATVSDAKMRRHFAAMAWWRFSADPKRYDPKPVLAALRECGASDIPERNADYLHAALVELSRLTREQVSAWFGVESLYDIATLFATDETGDVPMACAGCGLLRLGCTAYATSRAEACPFRDDAVLQAVARRVSETGKWGAALAAGAETPQAEPAETTAETADADAGVEVAVEEFMTQEEDGNAVEN